MTRRNWCWRIFFYVLGLMVLALGVTLNTKTGLGVSPIASISFSLSQIFGWNFGNVTCVVYIVYVAIEFLVRGKDRHYQDLLQLPLSMVFTRFLNLYNDTLPMAQTPFQQALLLLLAIVCTGVGAAMSIDMRLVPNAGDGIIAAISDVSGKDIGLVKNMFDAVNIAITFGIGVAFGHLFVGIGVGTVVAVLGIGRAMAVFNRLCLKKMYRLAGMSPDKNDR